MTAQNKIGIALAGLGFGAKVHLPALTENKDIELKSLYHPNQDRLAKLCKETSVKGYTDWNQLLADPSIKGVVIATPPAQRFQLACEALEAGKHLLLEKPVALNEEQIAHLQKLSIKNSLSVAIDFEYRAVPIFMQAKRLLLKGEIGRPWLVKFDWLMSSRANSSRPWNWYSQNDAGGGVLGALGTHAIDIIHWLCGPTQSVTATISTSIKERLDQKTGKLKAVTSEDIALAQLEVTELYGTSSFPLQLSLAAVTRQGRGCWLEIYGSDGTLVIGSENQKDYVHGFGLWSSKAEGPLCSITPDKDLAFNKTWTDGRIAPVARIQEWWSESILKSHPMVPGLSEGLSSQKVCDKIKESAKTGKKLLIQ